VVNSARSQADLSAARWNAGSVSAPVVAEVVASVPDPEIPVLTIADLGILREVRVEHDTVYVTITPTYSGCPAMDAIRQDIVDACAKAGWANVEIRTVLAPAWTTDWMTDEGKRKLEAYGIAPPRRRDEPIPLRLSVVCPQCGSAETREQSRFGSTACKALYVCHSCREPFEHVKAI
jgi:ring-1,2-phenylacetyl-CoA epoxidase subunit PaaD